MDGRKLGDPRRVESRAGGWVVVPRRSSRGGDCVSVVGGKLAGPRLVVLEGVGGHPGRLGFPGI